MRLHVLTRRSLIVYAQLKLETRLGQRVRGTCPGSVRRRKVELVHLVHHHHSPSLGRKLRACL
jgi:hypothetical protein